MLATFQRPQARLEAAYTPGQYAPVLDGLRGLAILLVLFRHAAPYMGADSLPEHLMGEALELGWIGVDLFFVLSGFLITGILLDTKGAPHYFRNFWARRALRIFPLYYGFLALVFFVVPVFYSYEGGEFGTLLDRQAWYWLYLVNVMVVTGEGAPLNTTHLWSLAVEEQFYLVWPAVVLWLSRARLAMLCVGLIVAAPLVRVLIVVAAGGEGHVGAYMLTPARADALGFGALLAVALRDPRGTVAVRRWTKPVAGVATTLVLAVLLLERGLEWHDVTTQTLGFTAIAAVSATLLALALSASPASPLYRALDLAWLRVLGKYSYAIYLFHYPLLNVARYGLGERTLPPLWGSQIPSQIAFTALLTLASLALAWVSWHAYEKHFLALKRFFPSPSADGARPPVAASAVWPSPRPKTHP